MGRGIDRSQDHADVVKLVQANHLPRDYGVDAQVRARRVISSVLDAIDQAGCRSHLR